MKIYRDKGKYIHTVQWSTISAWLPFEAEGMVQKFEGIMSKTTCFTIFTGGVRILQFVTIGLHTFTWKGYI